jgi:hypothetical protein
MQEQNAAPWRRESFGRGEVASLDGDTSNELFETLATWNTLLEHRRSDDQAVPPCP